MQVNHYDGEGLRHEMEENGNLVKFLYADRDVVAEEQEDGNIIRFVRGYDLVASDSESARTYYHYASDEQGSITHILGKDENGEYSLKNYYEYGAFGDFREKQEEVENRFGFNGEIFDPIGGQYYLRARYYNPVIGRFKQEDTYYGDGLNLYTYCRNLPIGYEDPSGHYCHHKEVALKVLEANGKEPLKTYQEYRDKYKNAKETRAAIERDFGELTPAQRAQLKGYAGIKTTKNGGADFRGTKYLYTDKNGKVYSFTIELTGSRSKDFTNAYNKMKVSAKDRKELEKNYTWHHVDDIEYDPKTQKYYSTIQLVKSDAHKATYPHKGSVSQYEKLTCKTYK